MLYIEGTVDKISRLNSKDEKKYDLIDIVSRDEFKRLNLFPVSDWTLKGDMKECETYKIPVEIKVYFKKGHKDPQISYQRKGSSDEVVKGEIDIKSIDIKSIEALLKKIQQSSEVETKSEVKPELKPEGEKDIEIPDTVPVELIEPVESGNGKKTKGLRSLVGL